MDKQKKYKKNYGIPFFAMAFLAAAVFEFYYIMTKPYSEFMLIGIGIIMLITGYANCLKSPLKSVLRLVPDREFKVLFDIPKLPFC